MILVASDRAWRKFRMYILLPLFKAHGKHVWCDPDGLYSFGTISLGDEVFLGFCPHLVAANSEIKIGNKVMFGPHVTVIGGNHNTSKIGLFMFDVKEKEPGDDLGVIIEDDVWVGARAVILSGVRLGRGSIVAAGSVVTKPVPPYAVVAGSPARVIKFRWNVETILRHEEKLYSQECRIPEWKLVEARRGLEE